MFRVRNLTLWIELPFFSLSSVQLLSHVRLFATLWTTACQASLPITNSWSLPKLMSLESVIPSNHLILCCPLLLLPWLFPSIRVFSNESVLCISWPNYWVSASTSVLPKNIQDWCPLGWTGWISLQSKGLSRVFSNTTVQKHQFFSAQLSLFLYFSLISIQLSFFLFAANVSALFCTLSPYSPLVTYDISIISCFFLIAAFFCLASTHDHVKDPPLTPKLSLTTVHLFLPFDKFLRIIRKKCYWFFILIVKVMSSF